MAGVFGATRNCLTSPPIGMTWATPGMVKRRGRMTKSAISRTSIGSAVSAVTANMRIWPMMELIGPICGVTFAGSCSLTRPRRSEICWRLRKMSVPHSNST